MRMSKAIADRRWPICGGACTVAPHTYRDTRPGTRGVNSRTSRVAVSCRRRVTLPRLWDAQTCPRGLFPLEEPGQAPSACHPFPVCRPDLPAIAGAALWGRPAAAAVRLIPQLRLARRQTERGRYA